MKATKVSDDQVFELRALRVILRKYLCVDDLRNE